MYPHKKGVGFSSMKQDLIYAALLHDIGKVYQRGSSPQGSHSYLGWKFLHENTHLTEGNKIIREGVLFHHEVEIKESNLPSTSFAHIVSMADNISSAIDRRHIDEQNKARWGQYDSYIRDTPLSSIFNLLFTTKDTVASEANTSKQPFSFKEFSFASTNTIPYTQGNYNEIIEDMKVNLKEFSFSSQHINSLLGYLEDAWSLVPSSTDVKQLVDISLYHHAKTTAAIATCMYDYFIYHEITDFKKATKPKFKNTLAFLLVSVKLEGAEDFIFNISGTNALKSLRARSLYVEMLLQHIVDNILESLSISRANLLFGGTHEYTMLLPNIPSALSALQEIQSQVNAWFAKYFKNAMFASIAHVVATPNDLKSKEALINLITAQENKCNSFFTPQEINSLNKHSAQLLQRECRECKRTDQLLKEKDICSLCNSLILISNDMRDKRYALINDDIECGIPLPFNQSLTLETLQQAQCEEENLPHRLYTKFSSISFPSIKLEMADYDYGDFDDIINQAQGVKRLGVLLVNIDNFSASLLNGFIPEYASISRTTAFSSSFTYFLKLYLNQSLQGQRTKARVIYSTGDNICIIGAWMELISFAKSFANDFKKFTLNKMTISMALGMFKYKLPITHMLKSTHQLMLAAKTVKGDNSICIFTPENTFDVITFENEVLDINLQTIRKHIKYDDVGATFIYKFLFFLRSIDTKEEGQINLARLAYLIASTKESGRMSQVFANFLYQSTLDATTRKHLILAFELYILEMRND